MKTTCLWTIALLLFGVVVTPGFADEKKEPRKITISFEDRDVRDVISAITDFGGGNVIISPNVKGKVTLHMKDVTWIDALEQAAAAVGAVATDEGHGIYRIEPKPAEGAKADPTKRVSFAFTDTDIRQVLAAIADFAELNLILSPKVEGKVTVRLNDVPARAAIEQIARTLGYAMVAEGAGAFRIRLPTKPASPRITIAFEKKPVGDVLTAIAEFAGFTVIVAPDVKGTVSIDVADAPARDALDTVAKQVGAIVREEVQGILRVEKP